MGVMIGADVVPARRRRSSYVDCSLDPFLPSRFATSRQILIHALPNQIGNRSPCCSRRLPKSFKLRVSQLHLSPYHANMLAEIPS